MTPGRRAQARCAVLCLALSGPLGAQPRAAAGGSVSIVAGERVFVGAGPVLLVPLERQVRLALASWLGSRGGAVANRSEALLELVLDPLAPGWTVYGAGGVALALDREQRDAFLALALGLEQRPRRARGWRFEVGVAGGVRVGVAYRVPLTRRP